MLNFYIGHNMKIITDFSASIEMSTEYALS